MNKLGFVLLECLLTLTILTTFIALLSKTEIRSVDKILNENARLARIFHIKNFHFNFKLKQKFNPIKKDKIYVNKLNLDIQGSLLEINKKSKLFQFKDDISIIKTVGKWKNEGNNDQLCFYSFKLNFNKNRKSS